MADSFSRVEFVMVGMRSVGWFRSYYGEMDGGAIAG